MDTPPPDNLLSVKPAGWYWRKAIREAKTIHQLRQLAYNLCEERDELNKVIRDHGIIPPRLYDPRQEALPLGGLDGKESSLGG